MNDDNTERGIVASLLGHGSKGGLVSRPSSEGTIRLEPYETVIVKLRLVGQNDSPATFFQGAVIRSNGISLQVSVVALLSTADRVCTTKTADSPEWARSLGFARVIGKAEARRQLPPCCGAFQKVAAPPPASERPAMNQLRAYSASYRAALLPVNLVIDLAASVCAASRFAAIFLHHCDSGRLPRRFCLPHRNLLHLAGP